MVAGGIGKGIELIYCQDLPEAYRFLRFFQFSREIEISIFTANTEKVRKKEYEATRRSRRKLKFEYRGSPFHG